MTRPAAATTGYGPILLLGDHDGRLAERLGRPTDLEPIDDLDRCLQRTSSLAAEGRPARIVVLAPTVPQPLTTARRVREAHASIGLAIVVEPDAVAATEAKLAFAPQLTDVVVVPSAPAARLDTELREAARAATERSRLDEALATMNAQLRDPAPRATRDVRAGVSERYLAALTRHAPDAIVSVDAEGRVVTANAAASRILGIEAAPEGRPIERVLVPDDPEHLARIMQEVAAGRVSEGVEVEIRWPDGTPHLLSLTAAPVERTADAPAGAVLLARDITQQRRAEQELRQLERAEGLATLAGGVAHDFNNLLMTIRGWATLARHDPTDEATVGSALEHIETASERAAELARAMLAYSGRSDTEHQRIDLNELVDGMRSLFAAAIPRRIRVELHLAEQLPPVDADPTQLRQVVLNLATNGAEAIGDDAGRIELRTWHTDDGQVVFEVIDTGHGMDERTAQRIFEPFFTTRFTGRGLGLAATRGIVRAHDGDIHVESTPGAGARFVVTLPAAEPRRTG